MTDPRSPRRALVGNEHLDLETLASLVDYGEFDGPPTPAQRHLENCRRCFAAFAEIAHHQMQWQLDEARVKVPAEWLEMARRVGEPAAAAEPRMRESWLRRLEPVPALAVVTIFVAAAVLLWKTAAIPPVSVDDSVTAPIRQQMVADASNSLLYCDTCIPLGANFRDGPRTDAAVENAVGVLAANYNDGKPEPDLAYWLIAGYLASGQSQSARLYLSEARERFPNDARFDFLAAIQAYKRSDLPAAEMHLRRVLAADRNNDAALFNLAVVLSQRDMQDEATRLIEELDTRAPGSDLANYARQRWFEAP